MPGIYDNIETHLLPTLRQTLADAYRADICVGYFNLRGWKSLYDLVDRFDGSPEGRARVLIGMHRAPEDEVRRSLRFAPRPDVVDGPALARRKREITENFREQLEFGAPSNEDERTLRRVASQLREGKLQIKLFLRHPLHAKLYLGFRHDHHTPILSYVGSSNLTVSGLSRQGELNVDVHDQDAARKLASWFHDRWEDTASLDISDELAALIEASWARTDVVPPYLVYLKMAYHLAQDAREGQREFKLPKEFHGELLPFQTQAVSLAVRHLNTRGGVLIGDVVGLGKTRVAAAVAKIYEKDQDSTSLILCPANLVTMWQSQVDRYHLNAKVMSLAKVMPTLRDLARHKLVLIDESHNLRNREAKRYAAIRDYIERNDSRVVLLSATPYNKQYEDLSNQLRLFVDEKRDLGVRPEQFFQTHSEMDFVARFQAPARSLTAFEKSPHPDDWRDLLRLYMVRRTRRFIIANYAEFDEARQRHFVPTDGGGFYFPERVPLNFEFGLDDGDPNDQYARLYQPGLVDVINGLCLPRYGLGNYVRGERDKARKQATPAEARTLDDLGRAGPRLMGFCRTNLFKRLESSGHSFLLSVERHVLRNMITLHAIATGQPIPIGTQESTPLDASRTDADGEAPEQLSAFTDYEGQSVTGRDAAEEEDAPEPEEDEAGRAAADAAVAAATPAPEQPALSWAAFEARAAQVYDTYRTLLPTRFKWIAPSFFTPALAKDLRRDAESLVAVLDSVGAWMPSQDAKLDALRDLVCETHGEEKVLVFTQFADTATYLADQLRRRGVPRVEAATAQVKDATALARRFSPESNRPPDSRESALKPGESEIRVLIATDALSEGQNLQDSAIVVNWDLPWAIIRLIQRAGRVDRIGQTSDTIRVYSFLPAAGVERVIGLQKRLTQRLKENHEVVGADETFFGEAEESKLRDLYTEKAHALDDEDTEVDLSSAALQVWKNALKADPSVARRVEALPNVVYASKRPGMDGGPTGVLVYLKTAEGADALVRADEAGEIVTQSLSAILTAAQCGPDTPGQPRHPNHHALVQGAIEHVLMEQSPEAGALGALRSARRRAWDRLTAFREKLRARPSLFIGLDSVDQCLQWLHQFPLTAQATDQINRQLRTDANDDDLVRLLLQLHEDDALSVVQDQPEPQEPRIVCSLGLFEAVGPS